ncbi:MAG: DUF2236 domain-containing protein [Chrysiogenetes bacterium]|nr:DUF2236 domain-containing protein [Chrysiogenetes bacterium]
MEQATTDNLVSIKKRPAQKKNRAKRMSLADVDPDLVPSRHFDPYGGEKSALKTGPFALLAKRYAPEPGHVERARQLTLVGDPLSDAFAALYPKLGYAVARKMLDTALNEGIEAVENAPEELKALFKELDSTPMWVDRRMIEKGAAVMRRYAFLSWLTMRLAFSQTYINANAGMPLYMTGSLSDKTVARRLKETSKWRMEVQQPGAMDRFGEGFKTTVRVRVLHSLLRHHLIANPEWNVEELGVPIPQIDMCGANVGMMAVHSYLLRGMGARISRSEMEAVIHFWRYHGFVIGVVDDLNPTSFHDVFRMFGRLAALIRFRFDERAAVLTRATFTAKMHEDEGLWGKFLDLVDINVSTGFFYLSSGKKLYELMGMKGSTGWPLFAPAIFPFVFAADTVRKAVPGGSRIASEIGRRQFARALSAEGVQNAPFNPYHMAG